MAATLDAPLKGKSGLDMDKAVQQLDSAAGTQSTGRCARYVREALQAGGVIINPHPVYAKDYGPYLLNKGFVEAPSKDYVPFKGDVAVLQPYPGGHVAGHIAMFNGEAWVSDFVQRDMWSGPGYRTNQPPYVIYRP